MHSRHKAASTKKRPEAFWVYEETGLPHPFAELAATGRRLARWVVKCKPRGEWKNLETNYRLQTSKKSSNYSADLGLSMFGALRLVRKNGSVELFNRDPVNYERAYKQMGTLALAFEMLMDVITINTLSDEFSKQNYE
jgi:hypothetical protein